MKYWINKRDFMKIIGVYSYYMNLYLSYLSGSSVGLRLTTKS